MLLMLSSFGSLSSETLRPSKSSNVPQKKMDIVKPHKYENMMSADDHFPSSNLLACPIAIFCSSKSQNRAYWFCSVNSVFEAIWGRGFQKTASLGCVYKNLG